MTIKFDRDKFGNIPCNIKSFRPDWLKDSEVQRRDGKTFENADGYHLLAVYILFEAVMAAAQQEDIELANESKEWLKSKAALPFFEECSLDHGQVETWIKANCPIPYLELEEIISAHWELP